jgi:hypothetical protein
VPPPVLLRLSATRVSLREILRQNRLDAIGSSATNE